jgi:hypothetical protein
MKPWTIALCLPSVSGIAHARKFVWQPSSSWPTKGGRMTTHYSAAELGNLVAAVNRIANSHRNRAAMGRLMRNLLNVIGGKGGTRTLDPGIMSAVL